MGYSHINQSFVFSSKPHELTRCLQPPKSQSAERRCSFVIREGLPGSYTSAAPFELQRTWFDFKTGTFNDKKGVGRDEVELVPIPQVTNTNARNFAVQ